MPKSITPAVETISKSEKVERILLAFFDFAGGAVYLNSTESDLSWDGHTWIGAGRVAGISKIEESEDLEAVGFTGFLNAGEGAPLALNEKFRGRPAKVWLAFRQNGAIVADPVLLAAARMDRMPITFGAAGRVELSCINRIADWQRGNAARWTDAEQKSRYPDDRAFEFVSDQREIPWGPTG